MDTSIQAPLSCYDSLAMYKTAPFLKCKIKKVTLLFQRVYWFKSLQFPNNC